MFVGAEVADLELDLFSGCCFLEHFFLLVIFYWNDWVVNLVDIQDTFINKLYSKTQNNITKKQKSYILTTKQKNQTKYFQD